MDSFDHYVIPKFGGIDLDSRPSSIPPEMTDDAKNVVGNGTYIAKRPGMRFIHQFGTFGIGPIYEMARVALGNATASGTKFCHDTIQMVYMTGTAISQSPLWGYWELRKQTAGGGTSLGSAMTGGFNPNIHIIPCSDRAQMTAGRDASGAYKYITPSGTTFDYTTTAGGGPTDKFLFGAWHKQHLFMLGSATYNKQHTFQFSDFNLPATWPSPVNIAEINPTGTVNPISGVFSDGELLYLGKLSEIYAITGTTVSDFRVERINSSFGFRGQRSLVGIGDGVMGFSVEPGGLDFSSGGAGSTGGPETAFLRNIFLAKGGSVQEVGDRVSPMLDNMDSGTDGLPSTAYNRLTRTAYFLPNPSGTISAQTCPMILYDVQADAWWKWEFSRTNGAYQNLPSSLLYAPSTDRYSKPKMYVGTYGGGLYWLDPSCALDEVNNGSGTTAQNQIESYWTSAWITRKSFENFKSLEDVFIQGKPNTAGSDPRLLVAVDYSPNFVDMGAFPLKEDGELVSVSGKVNMAKAVKIKIVFANDSYGGEVRRIVLAQKGFGLK